MTSENKFDFIGVLKIGFKSCPRSPSVGSTRHGEETKMGLLSLPKVPWKLYRGLFLQIFSFILRAQNGTGLKLSWIRMLKTAEKRITLGPMTNVTLDSWTPFFAVSWRNARSRRAIRNVETTIIVESPIIDGFFLKSVDLINGLQSCPFAKLSS